MTNTNIGEFIQVVAAVIVNKGKILLARRNCNELNGLWEFPGGKIEPNESWAVAVEREIFEELGINVSARKRLCIIEHDYPTKRVRLHFVECGLSHNNTENMFANDRIGWYSLEEIANLPMCPPDKLAVSRIPWEELLK